MTIFPKPLVDAQNEAPAIKLPLQRVGVTGLRVALELQKPPQTVMARADLAVDLSPGQRGIHMSRMIESLNSWRQPLTTASIVSLLKALQTSQQANSARVRFAFDCLLARSAPATGSVAPIAYPFRIEAGSERETLIFAVSASIPVMTVCPCSLAICRIGAHSQRTIISLTVKSASLPDLESLVALGEASGSSPVYSLLKREDEKAVTETAFGDPVFVEDAARRAALALSLRDDIVAWQVQAESLESIHNHNAFASLASPNWGGSQDGAPCFKNGLSRNQP